MGTLLQRIQRIADNEGIKITALEKIIGASKGVLSRAISNGTDIQTKWIQLIVENYPHYSADWLLTGRGSMLKTDTMPLMGDQDSPKEEDDRPVAIHTDNPKEGIPLIPINAMAGAMMGEQTVMEYECERYVVPLFKGAEFLIQVKGSSMYPKYNSGDVVACKHVPMTDLFFQWNKVYVLDTNQGALIKRIKKGSDADHILIVSDNKDYEPFELPIRCINNVSIVIGVIRLE